VASEPVGEGKISLIKIFGESAFREKGNKKNKKIIKINQNFIGLDPHTYNRCGD
jgi:hypothetical protein